MGTHLPRRSVSLSAIKFLVFIVFGLGAPMAFLDFLSLHYAMARVPMRGHSHPWTTVAMAWFALHVFIIGSALWGVGLRRRATASANWKLFLVRIALGACLLMVAYGLLVYSIVSW